MANALPRRHAHATDGGRCSKTSKWLNEMKATLAATNEEPAQSAGNPSASNAAARRRSFRYLNFYSYKHTHARRLGLSAAEPSAWFAAQFTKVCSVRWNYEFHFWWKVFRKQKSNRELIKITKPKLNVNMSPFAIACYLFNSSSIQVMCSWGAHRASTFLISRLWTGHYGNLTLNIRQSAAQSSACPLWCTDTVAVLTLHCPLTMHVVWTGVAPLAIYKD